MTMVHESARGTIGKLIGALVIGAAVVGIGTYMEPWAQEYEVKTALSLTCADMMKFRNLGPMPDDIREQLYGRLRRAQVKAKPEAVTLSNAHVVAQQKFVCESKVVYDTVTPWLGITMLKPDIPPLKIHHVVKVKKEIADRW
jgi:hypothetical protein